MFETMLNPAVVILALTVTAICTPSLATDLVYVPTNPSFGGNPVNGSILLNSASATNKHPAPTAASNGTLAQTPLQQFNSMLERSILSQLAAATGSKISAGGKLVPGTVETANFSITILDLGGGLLQITTTDKATGLSTSFQVSQ
ncbi:curli assembly protein CsgF [Massilia sp. PWRC2]|uniref:curli assembly protein CsgF n=1 Tax=Massilia sp. PWRC2 TaxID=2804626 RepID=UPI003CF9FCBB